MLVQRVSRAVLLYIALAVLQLVLVLIVSKSGSSISIAGVVLAVILCSYLYLGKPLAWWILVLTNSIGLLGLVGGLIAHAVSGDHILWATVSVLVLTTAAMEVVLLSPGMRLHVASRGLRLAPRPTVADSPTRPRP